ncbi:MAG: hypothetical protein DRP54_04800 [Spirochaetes bacterium]|nr:MAG: hypothetical protein DRP54_04800 [Spirochaetota bacterium]
MRKKAVAIVYNSSEFAPRLVAKGYDQIAEKIIRIAKENGVPVKYDDFLAEALIQLDIGDFIPEELYEVLAEVLAFVYRMRIDTYKRANV